MGVEIVPERTRRAVFWVQKRPPREEPRESPASLDILMNVSMHMLRNIVVNQGRSMTVDRSCTYDTLQHPHYGLELVSTNRELTQSSLTGV